MFKRIALGAVVVIFGCLPMFTGVASASPGNEDKGRSAEDRAAEETRGNAEGSAQGSKAEDGPANEAKGGPRTSSSITAEGDTTVDLHSPHVGATNPGFQSGECGPDPTDAFGWHFVLNGLDAGTSAGTLTATFENAGEKTASGDPVGKGKTQHFYVYTPGPDTLLAASAVVSAQSGTPRLVLSHVASGCLTGDVQENEIVNPVVSPVTLVNTSPSLVLADVGITEVLGVSFSKSPKQTAVLGVQFERGQALARTGNDSMTPMLLLAATFVAVGLGALKVGRRSA